MTSITILIEQHGEYLVRVTLNIGDGWMAVEYNHPCSGWTHEYRTKSVRKALAFIDKDTRLKSGGSDG